MILSPMPSFKHVKNVARMMEGHLDLDEHWSAGIQDSGIDVWNVWDIMAAIQAVAKCN